MYTLPHETINISGDTKNKEEEEEKENKENGKIGGEENPDGEMSEDDNTPQEISKEQQPKGYLTMPRYQLIAQAELMDLANKKSAREKDLETKVKDVAMWVIAEGIWVFQHDIKQIKVRFSAL